ncbi:hypothetical protein Tco_0428969, partial [Tanacetum coccineum]
YSAAEDEEYSQPSLMQRTMIENADWFSSSVIVISMEWGNFGSSHFPRTSSKIDLDVENQNTNEQLTRALLLEKCGGVGGADFDLQHLGAGRGNNAIVCLVGEKIMERNLMQSITEGPFQMGTFIKLLLKMLKNSGGALQLRSRRAESLQTFL